MKIILSRKGFDTSKGGGCFPSPLFEDASMLSLPIPDRYYGVPYSEIHWNEGDLATLVSTLTNDQRRLKHNAHIDPDLKYDSLERHPGWRPLFGQAFQAQGHLRNNNVTVGDLFIFFGLYRNVRKTDKGYIWDKNSHPKHIIWGWLQVDKFYEVGKMKVSEYPEWARYHPHFKNPSELNNTVYVSKEWLSLSGIPEETVPGAGVFSHVLDKLILTMPDQDYPTIWKLPEWFYPYDGKVPMTYHPDITRWEKKAGYTRLKSVSRGQEFIINTEYYPEAISWALEIIMMSRRLPKSE